MRIDESIWRIYIQILFYGGIKFMKERFVINWVVENGHPHYKVYDKVTDQTVHCDEGELNETIWEMLGESLRRSG